MYIQPDEHLNILTYFTCVFCIPIFYISLKGSERALKAILYVTDPLFYFTESSLVQQLLLFKLDFPAPDYIET